MAQFFKATPKNSNKKRILKNITIEKLDHQGRAIATFDNKPLFIEGALLGEIVDAQIVEDKKRYLKATIQKINKRSEDRITPQCEHYTSCGGCHLQHISSDTQINIKSQGLKTLFNRFANLQHVLLENPIQAEPWGYRRTARFGLQFNRKTKQLTMGFRRAQSNSLIEQKSCVVLLPELNTLIIPLQQLLNNLQGKADLGHVELLSSEQGVVVLLRHMKKLSKQDVTSIEAFSAQYKINFFSAPAKNELTLLAGEEKLTYSLPQWDCTFNFTPNDFLQVNPEVNQKMVQQALLWLALDKSDKVLDLFCGLGNFTLPIAQQVASIVGIEGVQKMVDRAAENALKNNITNASFYQADLNSNEVTKQDWAKQTFDKVLLDPARAGAFECMSFINSLKPSRIVYVSCDPVTLARDSQLLLEKGYKLDKLGLLDMFPQTAHMESMALFIKV